MDEFDVIREIFAPLAPEGAPAFGLTDDAAVLSPEAGRSLVISTDMLAAGTHFLPDDQPDVVAARSLGANLSDLAAMGAAPRGYFLTLSIPPDIEPGWLRLLAGRLLADQTRYGLALFGGDTITGAGPLTLAVTIVGSVPEGEALLRSGARAGDSVFVTGTLGDAALGLAGLKGEIAAVDSLIERYRTPEPRIEIGRKLRGLASACIDVSDGLIADLGHICAASGLGAAVERAKLPLSDAASELIESRPDLWPAITSGGDDYELIFTADAARELEILAICQETGTRITQVGRMTGGNVVTLTDEAGRDVTPATGGYRHRFGSDA
ncbi:MAG: thiamine-phosphate kinase [Sphingomonadales bacterium]|nr:thiamine-phosphate kinase [Sphingomonadales bacterium]